MIKKYQYFIILFSFFILFELIGCEDNSKRSSNNLEPTKHVITRGPSSIKYDYKGRLGVAGIASKASAYDGTTLIAEANAIKIIQKDKGANQIEVEELHYSPTGSINYKGILRIRFGFNGGYVEEEIPVSGKKQIQFFTGWPAGN
jgi:hypothetical protein